MSPAREPGAAALTALGAVCAQQTTAVADWLDAAADADFARPTVLAGWDLRTLTAHLLLIVRGLTAQLAAPVTAADAPAVTAAEYVRRYGAAAGDIAARTEQTRAALSGRELVQALRDHADPRPALAGREPGEPVHAARGTTTVLDWTRTRLLDVVAHADDLSRSFPERAPVPLLRPALADSTRLLAEILAAQAPGRSVEVRVPPFVAVQAVPGPRHTRGTPPNVVETDPLTFLRLATGRVGFAAAAADGRVRATGSRSDLSAFLPVLT